MERNSTEKQKKYIHLSFPEREEIFIKLSPGKRVIDIARDIDRDVSTMIKL